MSHNPYNAYSLGSHHSSFGSYQPPCPNVQLDPGNVREPSHTVPGSTHASIGASFGSSMNSSHIQPSLHPGTMGYVPGQRMPSAELDSTNEIQMKQAREDVSLKSQQQHQNRSITDCREVSLGFGPAGYSSSTAISQRPYSGYSNTLPSGDIRGTPNLLSSYQTKSSQASCNIYPSTSSSFHSAPNIPPSHYFQSSHSSVDVGNNGRMNKPYSTVAGTAPTARLTGDYKPFDSPSQFMNSANSQSRYSCDSAMDLLKRFNLQEEDLEELCAYPEDQLTPANLPYLLRDIRQKKAKRSSAPFPSSMVHQAQGSRFAPESSVGHGANVKHAKEAWSAFQQPSKVIEYGHTSKYSGSVPEEDDDRGPYCSSFRPSSIVESGLVECSTVQNLQKDVAPAKCDGPLSSHGSERSTTSSLSVCSPLSSLTASPSQRPASQFSKPAIKYPNKEPLVSQSVAPVGKPSATNTIPKSDSRADYVASAASQRPAPVAGATSQSPALGTKIASERPASGAGTFSHNAAGSKGTSSHRPFPWALPKFIPIGQVSPAAAVASIQSPPPAKPAHKSMPTVPMIRDYMGNTPEFFPHTCVLCYKPCVGVKDWLDHRKLVEHQASCRLLCIQYPEWEPDPVPDPVSLDPAHEESQQPPATATVPASSSQSSRPSLQATGHEGSAPSNTAAPLQISCGGESVSSVDRNTSETRKRKSRSKSTGRKRPRSKSSERKRSWSKSSGRKRSRSSESKRSWSPGRKRSRSPGRRRSRSSGRKRSRSPAVKRSRSRSSGRRRPRSSGRKWSPNWRLTSGKAYSARSSRHVHRRRSRSRSSSFSSSSDSSSRSYHHRKRPSSPSRRSGSTVRCQRSRGVRDFRSFRQTRRSRSGSRSPLPSSQRLGRGSSGCRKEETSVEQLAKKLLETSGVHTLAGSNSLEAVVKSLAPVLLAELAKLQASSSFSSTSSKDKNKPSSSSRDEQKRSSSSCRDEKKTSSSSSSRDAKRPSSSSSSRDANRPSSSSSSRDAKRPSSSSSSRDAKRPSSSSSSSDAKRPSSSSSSRDEQKQPSAPLTGGRKEPPSSSSSSAVEVIKKMAVKKSAPSKSEKPQGSALLGFVPAHPPLLLSGLPSTVTQAQVVSAVEKFGKTRLITLAKDPHVATVYFLQAAAAQALLGFTELKIGGDPITVTQIVQSVSPKLTGNQVRTKPANKALPRNKTTTPGNKITTPGNKTTPPGNMTTTPGNMTTTPGNKIITPGNMFITPGNKITTPGNQTTPAGNMTTTPGNKVTTPGNKTTPAGNMTTTPGNKVTTPGNKTTPAGNMTTTPGNKVTTPGNKTTPAGNMTTTPGNKVTTPGNKTIPAGNMTTPPGNKVTTPGNKTTPAGNMTTTPGNKVTTPGNKTTTAGNMTTTPGNKVTTPGNKTTPAGNMTTTPGNKVTTPGNKTTPAGNMTTPPGNKVTTPGNKTTPPGNMTTPPGNKVTTPGNKTTPAGNMTTPPGNKITTPGNKTIPAGNMTTPPGNKVTTPGNKTTPAGKVTTTPGNKITTPGNKTTPAGNMTTPPGNKVTTPGNKTTPAGNMTTTPGNKVTTPGNPAGNMTTTPGNNVTTPGHKTTPAGNMTTPPGNKFTTPGNKTTPAGNMTTPPGNKVTTPGNKTTPAGNMTNPPGNKVTTPGNKTTPAGKVTTTPGNKITTPDNKTTLPVSMTTTPSNKVTTPGHKTTPAGNMMTTPGNKVTTPGNKTTPAGNMTTTPGNKITTPGNKTTPAGNMTTTTDNMTTTPGNKIITPGNKTTPAGKVTTTPGNKITTPDNKTTPPVSMTTTPGNKVTTPGNKTTPAGKVTTTPGNKITTPDNKTTPPVSMTTTRSNKVTTPGHKTTPAGNMMTTPGNTVTTPGNKTTPAGNMTTTPGNKITTPGHKTTPAGNMTTTTDNMTTTPGNKIITPGNKITTPGNKTTPAVNMTTTLGNKVTTPGNKTTPPGNMMTTPGNKIITPGNKTTPAGNMTTTPGNKITTPGNKTTPPGNMTTTPVNMMTTPGNMMTTKDNMTTTPGNMTTTPGNKIIAPGNKITTPGNKTTTAGNMTTTPDNKFTSPDNKTTPPGNMTTIPLMSLPSETTPCSLEISNLNPIECIKVQSGTLAECDHDDMQINELVALPPSDQPLPSVSPEILPTELFLQSIKCIDVQKWTMEDLQPFANSGGTIMVTDLPTKGSKHREVGPILEKFSKIKCDKCFILPDNNTAFVEMEANKMEPLMDVLANGLSMKSATVRCHLLEEKALGSPIAFYKQLLKWSEKVCDETTLEYRLVYISNFHTDQDYWIKVFHDGINETGGVRVYLPLLGKIFVEFVTGEDADRFGLWLSSFRPKAKVKNLVRVMRPGIVPDMEAITPVCTNISHKTLVKGLQPPFWLVVPTLPCLYPTLTPQFYIPEHRTVSGPQDIEWAESCLTGQSVVMATGLPLGGYTHKDLVREVWPYFLDKDIPHVFYNVVILPLQRRAFIYFDDSLKCKEFASDYLQKPFTLGGCELTLHFLLDDLKPYDKEHFLFKHLLEWSYVSPKESLCNNQLVMTSITYVSMRALKFLFNVMRNSSYVCCIVLANRVIFQYSEKILLCKVMEILVKENKKYVGDRSIVFPKPYRFQTKDLYKGEHMTHRRHKELFNRASETYKNKSWPAPQDPSASPQDPRTQAGPDPPVLSPEVYRFFATAIRQHRQSRGVQEVSQEKRTSSEGLSLSQLGGKRSQISPLPSSSSASSSLSWRSRADGSPPPKRQRTEQMETMEDEDVSEEIAHPLVIFSSHPEVCDSQTKPSIVTKEQEAPSDRQVSEEVPRTSSYCSTSREVESSSSVTACSSSLSEASVSSTSDLPKSSSSSSVPPPSPVVLVSSSSEENTGKCPESPAQGCEDDDTTQPPSPPRMAKNDEVELPTGIPTAGPKRGRPPKRTAQNAQLEKEQPTAPVQEEAVVNPLEPTHAEDKLNVKEDGARAPLRRSSRRTNPALAKTRATATPAKSTREEQPLYQVTLRGKRGRKVTGSDAKENAAKKKKTTEQTAPPQTNEGAGEKESQEEGEERNPVAEMERQVTLNQVVEDEEQEKNAKGSEGRAGGTTKGELQPLVMLDDDTVKVEREGLQQTLAEPRPPLPEDQLVAKLEPESVKARWEQEEEEPKRVCSLSTLVANCYTLPPFTPHNPLGMNHVALKAGFYCKLCSVFYEDETKARTLHCSSLGHYNNLKVYYQRLKEENLGANPEAPLLANAPRRL